MAGRPKHVSRFIQRRWHIGRLPSFHRRTVTACRSHLRLAAPTVNCGKRFKPYSFAPTNASWGIENRTTAIRVKATPEDFTHIENRTGCGACNPYLLMASCVAAGIDGLKNTLEPPAPVPAIAYGLGGVVDLPIRLEDALDALERDDIMREALGPEFVKVFLAVKHHEINKAKTAISDYAAPAFEGRVDEWERSEFFEFL
jgi:glutamine synthetase